MTLSIIRMTFISIILSCSLCMESPISDTIMNDIEMAMKAVTNMSSELIRAKLIPELYNLKRGSSFLFKIPSKDNKSGYTMVSVERNEMMAPIFPNVTLNKRENNLQNQRLNVENSKTEEESKGIVEEDAKVWSSLGLDGWEGELTDPNGVLETEHRDNVTLHPKVESSANAKLENGSDQTAFVELNQNNKKIINRYEDSNEKRFPEKLSHRNLSKNIYIGRSNNPFGMSTKWTFRNESDKYPNEQRLKRSVPELYSIIICATGCQPLAYQSYGCYCGYQGDGIPVDGIDRCCKAHDTCYGNTNCLEYINYLVPYLWKCYYGKPICALDHGFFGGPNSCAATLCNCDRIFAMCLRRFQCPNVRNKAFCKTSLLRALQNIFL